MHLRQQPLRHVGDDDADGENESLQRNDVKEPVKCCSAVWMRARHERAGTSRMGYCTAVIAMMKKTTPRLMAMVAMILMK